MKGILWLAGAALAAFAAAKLQLWGAARGWGLSPVLLLAPAWLAGALACSRKKSALAGAAAGLGIGAALGPAGGALLAAAAGGALGLLGGRWQRGGRDWLSLAVCAEGALLLLAGGSPALAAARAAAGLLLALLVAWAAAEGEALALPPG